jgi:hypothetical protein
VSIILAARRLNYRCRYAICVIAVVPVALYVSVIVHQELDIGRGPFDGFPALHAQSEELRLVVRVRSSPKIAQTLADGPLDRS